MSTMAFENSEVLKKLKQQLTCPVCLDRYTQPRALPCHHSLCHECLSQYPVVIKGNSHMITCPVCRESTLWPENGVSGFKSAFFVNELLEHYEVLKKLSTTQNNGCDNCHRGPATGYCGQCSMSLCQTCIDMHSRWTPFTSHKVVGVGDVATTAMLSITDHGMGTTKELQDILPKLSVDETVDKSIYVALQRAYEDVEVRWKKDERVIVQQRDKIAELEEMLRSCKKEYLTIVTENKALKKDNQQLGNAVALEEQVQKLEEELRAFQEKHGQCIADKNDRLQQQQEVLDEKLIEVKGLQDQHKAMQTLIDTLNKENGQLKQQILQIREENGRNRQQQHQRSPRPPPHVQTGAPVTRQAPADLSGNSCPVCQHRFPRTINQVDIERHVNAHFDV